MRAADLALLFVSVSIAACGSLPVDERPALISMPTERSRGELLSVVTSAFNDRTVVLADDALTRDSVLIVERREARDTQGRALDGRVRDVPEHFKLVLRGSSCELVRESDGRRWRLTMTHCVPNPRGAAD